MDNALWYFFLVAGAGLAIAGVTRQVDSHHKKNAAAQADRSFRQIATIEQTESLTAGGLVCLVLMLIGVIWGGLLYLAATTVFQSIQAGVGTIVDILLFGLGVALLRKRSYRVFSSDKP